MSCHLCKVNKLRREFPNEPLTENCDHAPLHCLRCTTEHVEKEKKCSICSKPVDTDNPQYQECVDALKRLFPEIEAAQDITGTAAVEGPGSAGDNTITVSMMGGETTVFPYAANMTVTGLKRKIKEFFGTEPPQQRLLYKEKELLSHTDSQLGTLQYYGVQPFSTINLIIVLYVIPESFEEVIFDLSWDYPASGRDYLDASVLLYGGTKCVEIVDYRRLKSKTCPAVEHSGDEMDDSSRVGKHRINVNIKKIHESIDRMFFTLSAWKFENISNYPNPSLHFFDAKFPTKQLCSDSMQHAATSQAIIMCSLCKIEGAWKVLSLRKVSDGNAKGYDPLKSTISNLIKNGLC